MPYKRKQDYNKFMQNYMKQWRKQQAAMVRDMRKRLGIPQPRRGRRRKKK